MHTIQLKVMQTSPDFCVADVLAVLRRVPGVCGAIAVSQTGCVTVYHKNADVAALIEAVANMGYQAHRGRDADAKA